MLVKNITFRTLYAYFRRGASSHMVGFGGCAIRTILCFLQVISVYILGPFPEINSTHILIVHPYTYNA